MHKTILDTDILSDLLRGRNLNAVRRVEAYLIEHGHLTISVITAFEVVRGRHQARQFERAAQFPRRVFPRDVNLEVRDGGPMFHGLVVTEELPKQSQTALAPSPVC